MLSGINNNPIKNHTTDLLHIANAHKSNVFRSSFVAMVLYKSDFKP